MNKKSQDVPVRLSDIVSNHKVKLAGHFQNLVGSTSLKHTFIIFNHDGYSSGCLGYFLA